MVLIKQVFPCFHCFNKTTPSHLNILWHIFLFCGWANGMLLNCHMCQFTIALTFSFKMHLFRAKGICSSEISVWGVFDSYNLIAKSIKYLQYWLLIFFPKKIQIRKLIFSIYYCGTCWDQFPSYGIKFFHNCCKLVFLSLSICISNWVIYQDNFLLLPFLKVMLYSELILLNLSSVLVKIR